MHMEQVLVKKALFLLSLKPAPSSSPLLANIGKASNCVLAYTGSPMNQFHDETDSHKESIFCVIDAWGP